MIWIPGGANAVRTSPRTKLATVTDGEGRVLLVDLSRLDERWTESSPIADDALFATVRAILESDVLTPDPRIVWRSEPGLAGGTLASVVDPDTGFVFTGKLLETKTNVISVDPRIQIKANLGAADGLSEIGGVVPLGIAPPKSVTLTGSNASLGAFRFEVTLPVALDEALPGGTSPIAGGMLQETTYLHSGEMESSAVDLVGEGRGGWDVIFDRTYRSRTIGSSPMRMGWGASIFRRLRALLHGNVEYRDGAGEVWLYKTDGAGGYTASKGVFFLLRRNDRGWLMVDQKGRQTGFDDMGRVVFDGDEFATNPYAVDEGNVVRYLYGEDGLLHTIVDPIGRQSTLTYVDDRLRTVIARGAFVHAERAPGCDPHQSRCNADSRKRDEVGRRRTRDARHDGRSLRAHNRLFAVASAPRGRCRPRARAAGLDGARRAGLRRRGECRFDHANAFRDGHRVAADVRRLSQRRTSDAAHNHSARRVHRPHLQLRRGERGSSTI